MSDDPKWLAWRKEGITASDVAEGATGQYGKGPVGVVAAKLGLIDDMPTEEQQERFERGHALEERIITAAEALHGIHVVGEQMWCEHAEHSWLRCTVDGLTADVPEPTMDDITGVLEVKTRLYHADRPWDYWRAQVHVQMFVTQTTSALLAEAVVNDAGLILGVHLHRIEFDFVFWADLFDLAEKLWSWVQRREVPPATMAADVEAVKALTAKVDESASDVDLADMLSEIERRATLADRIKADTEEKTLIEARIRERIGGAKRGAAPGFNVSYSAPSRVLTDEAEAAILTARPDLGVLVLNKDRAKTEAPDLVDAHREAQAAIGIGGQ